MKTEWNLELLYKSIDDKRIEQDIVEIENLCLEFNKKYIDSDIINNNDVLYSSLLDYSTIYALFTPKPIFYLTLQTHRNSANTEAQAKLNILSNRITEASNNIQFYRIKIGKINKEKQKQILSNDRFRDYHFFLLSTFKDIEHMLSDKEENILSLMSLPAYKIWVDTNERSVSSSTIKWKKKNIPLQQALDLQGTVNRAERIELSRLIGEKLFSIADFSQTEITAIMTAKKIEDNLRKYNKPYEATIDDYRNDIGTVENLVKIVNSNFHISHDFYEIKARLLKIKKMKYCDRNAKYGEIKTNFSINNTNKLLSQLYGKLDKKYLTIFNDFLKNGQIDYKSRKGKRGGAYCWGNYSYPTYILLNHNNTFHNYTTLAHEMGHAFHTELSRAQNPLSFSYSMSLAETASTFFESLAFEQIASNLNKKDKVIALHSKISDDISTIFRQIACFNYENDIHKTIREKGLINKEELARLHNTHMQAYLGPKFQLDESDGYYFVHWSHIRRYFYVYSYAYGLLLSKYLLKRYREDNNFIKIIEEIFSAGGNDSPENILKKAGIDIDRDKIFQYGLDEIRKDIEELDRLSRNR